MPASTEVVFVDFASSVSKFTNAMKNMEKVLAKFKMGPPLEDLLQDLLDECRKGNMIVTQINRSASMGGTVTFDIEIQGSQAGLLGAPGRQPMNFRQLPARSLMDMGVSDPILLHKTRDGVYIGYRDFVWDPSKEILTSRNNIEWPQYRALEAICTTRKKHDAPNENCRCGIYAFDSPTHSDLSDSAWVWGEVALWGEVLVCETGYRAEFAYPQTLFMTDDGLKITKRTRRTIEKNYGVPVHLVDHRAGQTAEQFVAEELDKMVIAQLNFPKVAPDFTNLDKLDDRP